MDFNYFIYSFIILFIWYLSNAYCVIYSKEVILIYSWIAVYDETLIQFLLGILFSLIIIKYKKEEIIIINIINEINYNIIISSICHMLGSFLLCISYNLMSASVTQIIKSTDPIITVILSYLIEKKIFSIHIIISLFYIIIGLISCIKGDLTIDIIGFIIAMLSNIFMPLRNILCKKMTNSKYSPYQSYLITSFIAAISFLPIYLCFYITLMFQNPSSSPSPSSSSSSSSTLSYLDPIASFYHLIDLSKYIYLLVLAGSLHAIYNLAAFCFLDLVTPVSFSVANLCKRVVSIILAMLFFHEPVNSKSILSLLVLFVGVGVYIGATIEAESIYYQHSFCLILIGLLFFV